MNQVNTNTRFILAVCILMLIGCNETTKNTEVNNNDTTVANAAKINAPMAPAFDPATDPLTTGGNLTKKLSDTLGVKMYEFTVKPGQSWGVHTHPDHTVYVLQGGKMALYMGVAGKIDTLTFPTGMAFVSGPLTDSGKNIGKTTIKMLVTDLYRARRE